MPDTAQTSLTIRRAPRPDDSASAELGWRIAGLLSSYRLLVAVAVLVVFSALPEPRRVGDHAPELFQVVAVLYLMLGMIGLFAARQGSPRLELQLRAALLVDIFAIPLLLHASGGAPSSLGNLLILPIGACSLVFPRRTALMYASLAAMAILCEQGASYFEAITSAEEFFQAGQVGAIILLISLVGQPVSQRLRETEALAEQRGVDLADLAELNDYIIQHLRESIMVLDTDDTIRLINTTAARHLGHADALVGRHIKEVYPPLFEQAASWRNDAHETSSALSSFFSADGTTLLTPHFAPIGDKRPAPTLIFLEDATSLAERVQQTKLAALGRLSASIAHEIRNPVGAISHAGQLLGESDRLGTEEHRLTEIINSHCGRVNSIVKNVLQLSRRDHAEPQLLHLADWLNDFVLEFAAGVDDESALGLDVDDHAVVVRMDPSHLHQVMWNLCANAVRYAKPDKPDQPILIRAGRLTGTGRPFLEVLDRGPGIAEQFHQTVFEPFFTRAKDGTGLGLFIARELCEVNRATLAYEPRDGGGSCFRIIFADPERWSF